MNLFKALSSVKDKLTLSPNELLLKEVLSDADSVVSNASLYQAADLTFHPSEFSNVMEGIWTSVGAPAREWRRIQRGLILADVVMKFGSARCVQELRDYSDRFKHLRDFKYNDEDGDRGAIIREKTRYLLEILPDFSKIDREREIAKKYKNKCVGMSRDDVYRGNYKKNSSSNDVRGVKPENNEGYVSKEISKNEHKQPEVRRESIPQTEKIQIAHVEEKKTAPSFEPAKVDRNMNTSLSQPVIPSFATAPKENNSNPPYQPVPNNGQTGYLPQNIPSQGFGPNNFPQNYPPQSFPPNYTNQNYPPPSYPSQNYPPSNYPVQQYPPQNYPNQNFPNQNYTPQSFNPPNVQGFNNVGYAFNQNPGNNFNANVPTYANQFNTPPVINNPNNFNQGIPMQANKNNVKHNLPNFKDQVAPVAPKVENIDLESKLLNLDGLEFSLSNKKK